MILKSFKRESVNLTTHFFPPGADEFELAGLDEKPTVVVKPPGIKGCFA